jgi:predicted metal-dependent HD superfamily phosphohydrolase
MIPTDIVQQAAAHVRRTFDEADTKDLYFHSLSHTENVVQHAIEIGQLEHVTDEEMKILQVAAWFHDLGHLNGAAQGHELRSVDAAKQFLGHIGVNDQVFIQRVVDAIMATRMPHVPNDKLGEIMCDADVYHFGTEEFKETNKRVKKEMKRRDFPALVNDWPRRSLKLLESQHFFSPSVRQRLEDGKLENIKWLRKKIAETNGKEEVETTPEAAAALAEGAVSPEELLKNIRFLQKQNQNLLSRGIQTMLRLGSENHMNLSGMADGKANILISVNSIIISVILSVLINRLDDSPHLLIPTILFLTSSVITVVVAILATRPKLTEGTFTRDDIQRKQTNLLFFGNFYKSTLDDYMWAMNQMMQDKDYLYSTIVKDIYFLGKVLGRKYQLIRIAYNVFMIGLIVAVVSFTLAILLNTPSGQTTVINATSKPL